ncbi:MAG: hypothetical protein IKC04_02215 [Oscillospiraceae bacterium]|nr:hypothetical protein [Oscillospiraceae bacterium]
MVIQFNAKAQEPEKRIRYLITIDETETPSYVSRELQPGVITIMIAARTPEEAEDIRKESTAIVKTSA